MSCCCENKGKLKDVSKGLEVLSIDGLAANTDYTAIVTNEITGAQYAQSLTSSAGGNVQYDMTSPSAEFYMQGNKYKLEFIIDDFSNKQTVTLSGTVYDCLVFTIVKTLMPDETCEAFGTQTAELCNV